MTEENTFRDEDRGKGILLQLNTAEGNDGGRMFISGNTWAGLHNTVPYVLGGHLKYKQHRLYLIYILEGAARYAGLLCVPKGPRGS